MTRSPIRGRAAAMPAVLAALCPFALVACGGAAAHYASAPEAPAAAQEPVPLDRSVFARDPGGQLTEDNLQKILRSRLELDLPARVGLLPIVEPADWRGPGPDYSMAPAAVAELVSGLRGTEPFTLVSEMMPIPSGALGMEALREMAARYRLRYVVLYREHIARTRRTNPWAVAYATAVGALFMPGDTLRVNGYVEASLFDVKSGLLLFTVRRRVHGKRTTNVWHTDDKLAQMQHEVAVAAAPDLAADIRQAVYRFAEAAKVENDRADAAARTADAPAGDTTPAAGAAAAGPATDAASPQTDAAVATDA